MPTRCEEEWYSDQIQILIQKLVKAAGINTEQMPDYANAPTHGAGRKRYSRFPSSARARARANRIDVMRIQAR